MIFPFPFYHKIHFRPSKFTLFFNFCYSSVAGSHHHTQRRHMIQNPSETWFVKAICTLFCFQSHRLHFHSHFLIKNLTPLIAFQVVTRLDTSCCRNPLLALSFLDFSRSNLSLIHTLATYNYILSSLCQMGLFHSANLVVDWMILDGHSLNNSVLLFLVGSFLDSGRLDIAHKLLVKAKCEEMGGNPVVYNKFLNCLVRQNRVDEAFSFFGEHMVLKSCVDSCTFNILIRGLCKAGQVDRAYKLFGEMVNYGSYPDVITYNTMIDGLCRVNRVGEARELLMEIRFRDDISPDVVTFTSIIAGYCKLNMMDDASFLFQDMTNSGIGPSLVTFNVLIDGYAKIGDMTSVSAMYEKMLYLGIFPDVVTFTSRIDGYCRKGQVDEGLKLLQEMVNWNSFPNEYTFSILIIALCKENRLNEACDLLRQLKLRNDIVLQPFMYNPIIDGLCKAGKIDEANLIVLEMEERKCKHDKYTFTILIIGHCMKGRMLEAMQIFSKMLSAKCTPDNITVESLQSCLVKAGMPEEASQIEKHIAVGKVEIDMSSSRRNLLVNTNMNIEVAA